MRICMTGDGGIIYPEEKDIYLIRKGFKLASEGYLSKACCHTYWILLMIATMIENL